MFESLANAGFQIGFESHAAAILATDFAPAVAELESALHATAIPIEEIIAGGIHEFIDGFQTRLNLVGEAIYEAFFALPPAHDFAPPGPARQSQTQSQTLEREVTA